MAAKEAPYQQSRAALRKLYGTRSINASAPQSAADDTPSGRFRFAEGRGADPDQAARARDAAFGRLFRMNQPQPVSDNPRIPGLPDTAPSNAAWLIEGVSKPVVTQPVVEGEIPPPLMAPLRTPETALEAVDQANATGASSGTFAVPQYGGSVSFRRPSLMPTAPTADMSAYLGGFARSDTPFSFFKPQPRPSILTGAQKWVANI